MSKGYQSYDRRKKDLTFGDRLAYLLALTRGIVMLSMQAIKYVHQGA